ncbi:MAG: hypothetical protein EBS64_07755 [Verrucomicrobia bacterium]|nr:hypothetical protein [Verrucomicrobiota bacterium]
MRGTDPTNALDPASITRTAAPAQTAGFQSSQPVKPSSSTVASGLSIAFGSTSSSSSGDDDYVNPWVTGSLYYPYAPKKYNHVMAIKEILEPKPGSYLLIWRQAGLTGASGLPHQYAITRPHTHRRGLPHLAHPHADADRRRYA